MPSLGRSLPCGSSSSGSSAGIAPSKKRGRQGLEETSETRDDDVLPDLVSLKKEERVLDLAIPTGLLERRGDFADWFEKTPFLLNHYPACFWKFDGGPSAWATRRIGSEVWVVNGRLGDCNRENYKNWHRSWLPDIPESDPAFQKRANFLPCGEDLAAVSELGNVGGQSAAMLFCRDLSQLQFFRIVMQKPYYDDSTGVFNKNADLGKLTAELVAAGWQHPAYPDSEQKARRRLGDVWRELCLPKRCPWIVKERATDMQTVMNSKGKLLPKGATTAALLCPLDDRPVICRKFPCGPRPLTSGQAALPNDSDGKTVTSEASRVSHPRAARMQGQRKNRSGLAVGTSLPDAPNQVGGPVDHMARAYQRPPCGNLDHPEADAWLVCRRCAFVFDMGEISGRPGTNYYLSPAELCVLFEAMLPNIARNMTTKGASKTKTTKQTQKTGKDSASKIYRVDLDVAFPNGVGVTEALNILAGVFRNGKHTLAASSRKNIRGAKDSGEKKPNLKEDAQNLKDRGRDSKDSESNFEETKPGMEKGEKRRSALQAITLGATRQYRSFGAQLSSLTKTAKGQFLTRMMAKLLHSLYEKHKAQTIPTWTSVTINYSFATAPHVDAGNLSGVPSVIVVLGKYTGGRLWVRSGATVPPTRLDGSRAVGETGILGGEEGTFYDVKEYPLLFYGGDKHGTEPFSGERICCVWYCYGGAYTVKNADHKAEREKLMTQLRELNISPLDETAFDASGITIAEEEQPLACIDENSRALFEARENPQNVDFGPTFNKTAYGHYIEAVIDGLVAEHQEEQQRELAAQRPELPAKKPRGIPMVDL